MKCKDCKWYVPDVPPESITTVGYVNGTVSYIERKVYKRCSMLLERYGHMSYCKGSHKYCFKPKDGK